MSSNIWGVRCIVKYWKNCIYVTKCTKSSKISRCHIFFVFINMFKKLYGFSLLSLLMKQIGWVIQFSNLSRLFYNSISKLSPTVLLYILWTALNLVIVQVKIAWLKWKIITFYQTQDCKRQGQSLTMDVSEQTGKEDGTVFGIREKGDFKMKDSNKRYIGHDW